jgi:type II secretion system protein J
MRKGFTLLELLAATAMVAVLAMAIGASLQIAFRGRATALAAVDSVRKSNWALEVMRADLQSAVRPNGELSGSFVDNKGGQGMGGGGTDLIFTTAFMDNQPLASTCDLKQVEYCCEQASDSSQLNLVRHVTYDLLAQVTPVPTDEIICRDVTSFITTYYDGNTWQNTWDSTSTGAQSGYLPVAVQATIEFRGKDKDRQKGPSVTQIMLVPCGVANTLTVSSASGGM